MPGAPEAPYFTRFRQGTSGLMPGELSAKADTRALEAYRERALAPSGESPWLDIQKQKAAVETAMMRDQLAQAGARDRMLGAQGANRLQMATGGIGASPISQALSDRLRQDVSLEQQAQDQQIGKLMNLPGMDLQALAPQEFNIRTALQEKNLEEAAKMKNYEEQMKAWGATKSAGAIAGGGKK